MGRHLLNLPLEIRAEILGHLVVTEHVVEPYMADSSRSMKSLSTKVLLTCKRIYTEAVYLLYHKNTFVFRLPSRLEDFCTQIGAANLATVRDLRIVLYGDHTNLHHQRTALAKNDVHQEEEWDDVNPGDVRGISGEIQLLILRMYHWTFALPKLPKEAREITMYTSSRLFPSAKTLSHDYDDPIVAYFLGPEILGHFFEGLYRRGAKINWIPGTQVIYRFTGQALTFEDVQRLRHEMEAAVAALELQLDPYFQFPQCVEHRGAFLRAHRDTLSPPLAKAIAERRKPWINTRLTPQRSDRAGGSEHETECTDLGDVEHTGSAWDMDEDQHAWTCSVCAGTIQGGSSGDLWNFRRAVVRTFCETTENTRMLPDYHFGR